MKYAKGYTIDGVRRHIRLSTGDLVPLLIEHHAADNREQAQRLIGLFTNFDQVGLLNLLAELLLREAGHFPGDPIDVRDQLRHKLSERLLAVMARLEDEQLWDAPSHLNAHELNDLYDLLTSMPWVEQLPDPDFEDTEGLLEYLREAKDRLVAVARTQQAGVPDVSGRLFDVHLARIPVSDPKDVPGDPTQVFEYHDMRAPDTETAYGNDIGQVAAQVNVYELGNGTKYAITMTEPFGGFGGVAWSEEDAFLFVSTLVRYEHIRRKLGGASPQGGPARVVYSTSEEMGDDA